MPSKLLDMPLRECGESFTSTDTCRKYICDLVRVYYGDKFSRQEINSKLDLASDDEILQIIQDFDWAWGE